MNRITLSRPTRDGTLNATVEANSPRDAREITKELKTQAKEQAPRKSGRLVGSIKSATDGSNGAVVIGAKHGGFNQWGTRRMKANPFMTRAVEATAAQFDAQAVLPAAPKIQRTKPKAVAKKGKR